MRGVRLLLALLVILAFALVFWMLRGDGPTAEPPTPKPPAAEPEEALLPQLRTTSLTIRVRTPDGQVPPGAEVGYMEGKHARVLYVEEDGSRTFAAAPAGEIEIVARAAGYEEARALRVLTGGVVEEVTLVMKPKAE